MSRPSLGSTPTVRWLIAAALLTLVAHELHEIVHTWTGRALCGAWGARDFNVWSLAPGCTTWVPTLVGPIFSWAVMWLGLALLVSRDERMRWIGLAAVFAPNPLGRLLPALFGGGDEGVVARSLLGRNAHYSRIAVLVTALLIIMPPLVVAWRSLHGRHRARWFGALFCGGILVTGPLLLLLGNGLLAREVLARPGMFGAPLLVEFFAAAAMLACAVTAPWLRDHATASTRPAWGQSP